MSQRLTPFEEELGQRVDEVLHYVWDPIGVAAEPYARDEYSGYSMRALGLLLESANTQGLVDFLLEIEEHRMGLSPKPEHALRVAALLLEWKGALRQKYDRPEEVWRPLRS